MQATELAEYFDTSVVQIRKYLEGTCVTPLELDFHQIQISPTPLGEFPIESLTPERYAKLRPRANALANGDVMYLVQQEFMTATFEFPVAEILRKMFGKDDLSVIIKLCQVTKELPSHAWLYSPRSAFMYTQVDGIWRFSGISGKPLSRVELGGHLGYHDLRNLYYAKK